MNYLKIEIIIHFFLRVDRTYLRLTEQEWTSLPVDVSIEEYFCCT